MPTSARCAARLPESRRIGEHGLFTPRGGSMYRLFSYTTVLFIALATTAALAQKVTNPDELDKTMKRIAPAQGAAGKAIQSMSWADAKAQVAVVKQALIDTESFWAVAKKDDAVAMLKDSIAKVTAVE